MNELTFNFSAYGFNRLFPFYIVFDDQLAIQSFGKSLNKVCPEIELNSNFTSCFQIVRPHFKKPTYEELVGTCNQIIIIKYRKSKISLRGQLEIIQGGLLFVGTPWFNSVSDLVSKELTLRDFAIHDPLIDLLHVLNNQENTSRELKQLLKVVNNQKNKLKKDQEELNRLSLVASTNGNGVIFIEPNGTIFWCNNSYIALTGFEREEILGKNPIDIGFCAQTNVADLKKMKLAFFKGEAFEVEFAHGKKDGTNFWSKSKGHPIIDTNGKVSQFFAVIEDISNEKVFKTKLIESENRLASLILNLETAVLLEDENRKILLVNEKFCSMFGINSPPKNLIGLDCTNSADDVKHLFKNPEAFVTRINTILTDKQNVVNEEIELLDGRVFSRGFIPMYEEDKYNGHLWTYEDITFNKRYEENLEAEKEKYSSIIANMNLGLIEVNKEDVITLVNQSFTTISGYSTEELIGKSASELFLSEEGKEIIKRKNDLREKGKTDSYEIETRNKAGNKRNWLISGAPNYDRNGNVIGSIGIHLDITEQKELEQQREFLVESLAKSNKELEDYASIASHDLKSPLRSIHSLISWIKEDNEKELGENTSKYLSLIEGKVEKMDHLIEGILTYTKVDKIDTIFEEVDLNEVIENIINIIYIPDHISVEIKTKLPMLYSDRYKAQQLFQNLISNAVNYCDKEKGIITVSCYEEQNYSIFSIRDNGAGIAKENLEKIFKIFHSLESNNKSTGLGLSIVKKIVDNLEGEIWVESEVGIGTSFYIKLKK